MLDSRETPYQNIVLVGFMASGKSTVGRMLAEQLGWEFLDTDQQVEKVTGIRIPDLFRKYGEIRFRSEEKLVVRKLAELSQTVIATGGGTVLAADNWELLQRLGLTVHLYAPLEVALKRVKRRQDRPLLTKSFSELETLWLERLNIYQEAHITIDTSDKNVEEIVADILAVWKGGNLNQ